MSQVATRRTAVVAALFAVTLIASACGGNDANDAVTQTSSVSGSMTGSTGSTGSTTPPTSASGEETSTSSVAEPSASAASGQVTIMGERDVEVTLTGPIAAKYSSATAAQKSALGKPLTGDHNAGTRDSGVVFQQFQGGVIIAKNDDEGTPAYIVTSGKIRDAWNTERAPDGTPSLSGQNGSAGPLGVPTSDLTTQGQLETVTFEHGKITENTRTGVVTVTVNGKVVPSGLS
ncbi:LGFP repeat-containing protein [Gordonia sp. NPDC003504]